MPFFWVNSIFVSFFFLLVLVLIYNMITSYLCFSFNLSKNLKFFLIKW